MSIKCSYSTCFLLFSSESDMKKHKKKDPSHSFCHKCDVDLEDDLEYFIHQIESPQHIVCPVCGTEFKSNSGRDRHVELSHHSDQHLPCAGCGEVFTRPSGLMGHIERGQCSIIRFEDFQRQRAEKQVEKDAVTDMVNPYGGSSIGNDKLSTVETEVTAGPSLLLDDPSEHIPTDWQGMPLQPVSPNIAQPFDNSRFPTLKPADKNANRSSNSQIAPPAGQGDLLDLDEPEQRFQRLQISPTGGNSTSNTNNNGVPTMFEKLTQDSLNKLNDGQTPTSASVQSRTTTNDSQSKFSIMSMFNPNSFYDQIRDKYVCPGRRCKKDFDSAEEFKAHLLTGVHLAGKVTCPSCLKRFRTTTALISHCESASRRCNIRTSTNYNQVLREITGGLIGSENFLEDGSIRYTAPDISEW